MKKVLASLLVFTMLICSTITASAKEITVEDKIAYLISQGFPEDFLSLGQERK